MRFRHESPGSLVAFLANDWIDERLVAFRQCSMTHCGLPCDFIATPDGEKTVDLWDNWAILPCFEIILKKKFMSFGIVANLHEIQNLLKLQIANWLPRINAGTNDVAGYVKG